MAHERCGFCRQPIMGTPVMVERYVCAATMSSPAEYEDVPMHKPCAERAQSPDYAEYLKDEAADRKRNERLGL